MAWDRVDAEEWKFAWPMIFKLILNVARLRKESPSNAKADTRCVPQYSGWHGCGDLSHGMRAC